jgi:hypothetical protein
LDKRYTDLGKYSPGTSINLSRIVNKTTKQVCIAVIPSQIQTEYFSNMELLPLQPAQKWMVRKKYKCTLKKTKEINIIFL